MKKYAIIVAGGSGKRMQTSVPKQFIVIKNKAVLMHTIEAFYNYDNDMEIIVVIPENQFDYWEELCYNFNFDIRHTIIEGGEERFFSVKNALEVIENEALVAVHDGVRPLIDRETIHRCFEAAEKNGAAIPVVPLKESIRKLENMTSVAQNRNDFCNVQTPQIFRYEILMEAYKQNFNTNFTDDASVVEADGHKIYTVNGAEQNIKLTTPYDLIFAEILLAKNINCCDV